MTSKPVSLPRAIIMYIAVALFLFFEMAVQVSPSVMASALMRDLNIGTFGLGLMSGLYFYSYTIMQIPTGILLDKNNPRLVIVASILTCTIGTLLFSLANSVYIASLARLIMGAGSAFAFVSVLVVTADLFEEKYFALITGITQSLAALGAMAGQMPISILVSDFGWKTTMSIITVIGLSIALCILILLTYQRDNRCIKAICPHYKKSKHLKTIFKNSQTWFIAIYASLLWAPMAGFASLWGVPFLEHSYQLSPHLAALFCSFMWLGLAIASPLLGFLSTRANNRKFYLFISAFVGCLSFALLLFIHLSTSMLIIFTFLAGAACSGQALSFSVVKENNSITNRATAIAINNMAVVIAGAFFQPLIGKLLSLCQHFGEMHCYRDAIGIILVCYGLAAFIAIALIKNPNSLRSESSIKT